MSRWGMSRCPPTHPSSSAGVNWYDRYELIRHFHTCVSCTWFLFISSNPLCSLTSFALLSHCCWSLIQFHTLCFCSSWLPETKEDYDLSDSLVSFAMISSSTHPSYKYLRSSVKLHCLYVTFSCPLPSNCECQDWYHILSMLSIVSIKH